MHSGLDRLIPRQIDENCGALDELFSRHRFRLYKTALKILRNHDDAEDALQDGLLAAWRSLERFEGRSQFSTWLTRIVVNAALVRRRQDHYERIISVDQSLGEDDHSLAGWITDPRPNPEEVCVWQEQVELMECLLNCVPTIDSRAFWLRHIKGLKVREVAEIMGIPVGTLKSQLHRARRRLRKVVTNIRRSGQAPLRKQLKSGQAMYESGAYRR